MNLLYLAALAAPFIGFTQAAIAINTPAPMLQPAFPHCEQFYQAASGDTCYTLISRANISPSEFFDLNPALDGQSGCTSGKIIPGHWYCFKAASQLHGRLRGHLPQEPARPAMPMPTKPPPDPESCDYGSCWKAWVKLSTESEDYVVTDASASCTRLFERECNFDVIDFPADIKAGCGSCEALSSGCPCFTKGLYNTYTIGYEYGND